MRIRRIKLKGVRSFALPFENELYDTWNETVPSPFLVHGPNGSGKTTYLHVIAALWEYFGKALRKNPAIGREVASVKSSLLDEVGFAGIQVEGCPIPRTDLVLCGRRGGGISVQATICRPPSLGEPYAFPAVAKCSPRIARHSPPGLPSAAKPFSTDARRSSPMS